MRAVVCGQLRDQRGGKQLHEQALRDLGRQADEDAVTPVLAILSLPRESGLPERLAHRPVQPVAYPSLVRVGATVIPEALDVEDDDRPVDGSSVMHFAHLPETPAGMVRGMPAKDYRNLLRPGRPSRQGKLALPASQANTTFTYPDKSRFIS